MHVASSDSKTHPLYAAFQYFQYDNVTTSKLTQILSKTKVNTQTNWTEYLLDFNFTFDDIIGLKPYKSILLDMNIPKLKFDLFDRFFVVLKLCNF